MLLSVKEKKVYKDYINMLMNVDNVDHERSGRTLTCIN